MQSTYRIKSHAWCHCINVAVRIVSKYKRFANESILIGRAIMTLQTKT